MAIDLPTWCTGGIGNKAELALQGGEGYGLRYDILTRSPMEILVEPSDPKDQ
jgi:hypothetical protein